MIKVTVWNEFRTFHQKEIQLVIKNAVRWAKPTSFAYPTYGNTKALEA